MDVRRCPCRSVGRTIGVIVLAYAARRAHVGLASSEATFGAV